MCAADQVRPITIIAPDLNDGQKSSIFFIAEDGILASDAARNRR
jgi:hypothetical protein